MLTISSIRSLRAFLGAAAASSLAVLIALIPAQTAPERVPVVFSGGHETDPADMGRPVILIAGALCVSPEVFREAFSHVHPAPAGTAPSRERVHENKETLLAALGPHGVTNDRLDEVSDHYRYNRGRGEMWPTEAATACALVENGAVTGFEITNGGSGYTTPPTVTIPGHPECRVVARLTFGRDFETNGAVVGLEVRGN